MFEIPQSPDCQRNKGQRNYKKQRRQLSESKQRIEAELGIRVDLLAYPNGRLVDFDEGTEHVAAQSGYTHAFTCTFGWNQPSTPRYELRRVVIEPTDGLRSLVLPFRYALTSAIRSRLRRPASG